MGRKYNSAGEFFGGIGVLVAGILYLLWDLFTCCSKSEDERPSNVSMACNFMGAIIAIVAGSVLVARGN